MGGDQYDAGSFAIDIPLTDLADYAPSTDYNFKVELMDNQADDPAATLVSDEFTVTVYDRCTRNKLTLDTDNPDIEYVVDPGNVSDLAVAAISFTSTYPESICPLDRELQILDDTGTWVPYDPSTDASTYPWLTNPVDTAFTVNTDDLTYDDETTDGGTKFQIRQVVSDPKSLEPEGTLHDDVELAIR